MIHILSWTIKNNKKHFPCHKIHSWRKFKEKWHSRTFQGLPLNFKDISRLCEPCLITKLDHYFWNSIDAKTSLSPFEKTHIGAWHGPFNVVHNYFSFNRLPVYPGKQVQLKPFTRSVQFPLTQGLDAHSLISVEQLKSENPGLHVQLYVPSKFRQVALFWQTCRSHSFMSVSQFFPVQPDAHVQV